MRRRLFVLAIAAAMAFGMLPAGAVPTPVVASDNVELLAQMPDVAAISTTFSSDSPHMYVSTLHGFSVYDISDPALPKLLAELPFVYWENESMSMGERVAEDGTKTKFALIGLDIYGVSPTDATKRASVSGEEVIVVDVTNPAAPRIRGRVNTPSSTHTVACVTKDCQYAYTSGAYDAGKFHVVDLTDLDAPKVVKELNNVAGDGHQWDLDALGNIWSTGGDGAAGYDISDPLNPRALASTDRNGTMSPYNDFIMHNAWHPGAENFTQVQDEATGRLVSGSKETASVFDGNVLLVTEEDYDNPRCGGGAGEGTFSTWYIPYQDADQYAADNPAYKKNLGQMTPLDTWNTEILNTGQGTVAGALCSAHYFTYHDAGFIAQGWYQQGTRILDVRNPHDIKQVGYFFTGASETWHAYWVPEYVDGVQTGRDTNIVYTNDAARGIDILRVGLPETPAEGTAPVEAPILPQWLAAGVNAVASLPSDDWGYLCRLTTPRI